MNGFELLDRLLGNQKSKLSRKVTKKGKNSSCIIQLTEHGTLILRGTFKNKPVNVLVPNGTTISDKLVKLEQLTWGHARELVNQFVKPNLEEIVYHLTKNGEYKLF